MPSLKVEVDPSEVGLDAGALDRLSVHFDRYVDSGKLPGYAILVSRAGQIAYATHRGLSDVESGEPTKSDTLYRIFSMTKPVTSLAAMMLVEEGKLGLNDPVSRYLPEFGEMSIFSKGTARQPVVVPAQNQMLIWHLLTHTSGLTYGFHYADNVDSIYRQRGYEWGSPKGHNLEQVCQDFASMPLVFEPGTQWNYSVATDVLGRVVEVVSQMSLSEFFRTRIFEPLGMGDTGFHVTQEHQHRLASLYVFDPTTKSKVKIPGVGDVATSDPSYLSGGGGLISTTYDYHRFTQMLLGRGTLDGVRLVSSRTIDYMTMNHLPNNADLESFGRPLFAESSFRGVGFGLGFSVVVDPAATKAICSLGLYGWGGAASTAFNVDPREELTVIFMTQLLPSSTYPIRPELLQLVYGALI